jgi:hydroxymethylbilane synthase
VTLSPVRIGTRGSALARAQAGLVAASLEALGHPYEIVLVETEGDRRAPDTVWGEGAFVTAIEQALLDDRIDLAVHSAKDVPTAEDDRLRIVAFLPRAEPGDALVLPLGAAPATLDTLPAGSRIGTDSPRRAGFLLARRPDLVVRPLHGNVDTRLRKLDDGLADALVLAVAGLVRLGRADRISERISTRLIPPATGQGAVALQGRADDARVAAIGATIDDAPTRRAVEAERAFLRASGGGCRAPIGALAEVDGDRIRVFAGYAAVNGTATAFEEAMGPIEDGPALATEVARRLGARLDRPSLAIDVTPDHRVLVTRPAGGLVPLARHLREAGIEPAIVPAIEIEPVEPDEDLDAELRRLGDHDWAVVTSPNGARAVGVAAERLGVSLTAVRWGAIGEGTAEELAQHGVGDAWLPSVSLGLAVAAELPIRQGDRVLLARGSLADARLPSGLRDRGAEVREVVAYRTREAPSMSRRLLAAALRDGPLDAVLFASGSAVRGLLSLATSLDTAGNTGDGLDGGPALGATDHLRRVLALPAICIGPETEREARDRGFSVLGTADRQGPDDLARLTRDLLTSPTPAPQEVPS